MRTVIERLLYPVIAVAILGVDTVFASEALVALYNRGNEYYRAGDFDAAISAYERVIAQGLSNGEVYYNLGNAYFKNAQLGRAILSYERALNLMPGDRDVLANLQFANARKIDRESEDEVNILTRVLQAFFCVFYARRAGSYGLCVCFLCGQRGCVLDFCAGASFAVGWVASDFCSRTFGQCGYAGV